MIALATAMTPGQRGEMEARKMGGDRPEMITQHAFQIWDRGARLSGSHDRHCQQAGRDRPRGRSGLTGARLAANGRDWHMADHATKRRI